MKDVAEANCRPKRMYAEMSMQNDLLKEVAWKKREAVSKARDGHECSRKARRQYRIGVPYVLG